MEKVARSNNYLIACISIVSIFVFYFSFDYLLITSIGLSFSLYISLRFIDLLGKAYPLKELICLLSALQWVVGAKISYEYGDIHYKYYMYVDESEYMFLVVPSVVLMYIGLKLFRLPNLKAKLDLDIEKSEIDRGRIIRTANTLLFSGVSALVLSKVSTISGMGFVLFLMSLLIYVSVGYYFYLYPKKRTLIFLLILLIAFLEALTNGMFHNFLLVGVFLFALYVGGNTSFYKKVIIILIASIFINVIHIVKKDYREVIWKSQVNNKVEVFVQLLEKEFFVSASESEALTSNVKQEEDMKNVTTRVNQGWIISKVIDHVPKYQDFIHGESVRDAISASLLPRFLFPDKSSGLDAKRTFEKVTGLRLIGSTSMGLSLVGEFYANYGTYGAWVAMLSYGLFIGFFLRTIVRISGTSPFILLWLIVIFFQVIKAETELIKVLNHIIKASIFVFILHLGLRMFGVNLFPKVKEAEK